MPNWCNNNFAIAGSTESIKDLWESAQAAKGLLQAIMPMPEILEGTTSPAPADLDPVLRQTMIAQTGYDNWYDWQVANWGTKWDVDLEGLEYVDNGDGTASISGWFDSAWAPPIGAYEQLADDFDSCVIECSYYEPGMDFAGFWSSEDGDEYIDNLHEQYELGDNASDLYKRLDDEFGLSEQFEQWDEDYEEDEDLTDLSPNTV